MPINVLFAAKPERWAVYGPILKRTFNEVGLDVDLRLDFDPAEVDYLVYAPNGPVTDFTPFTRAKAVLNLWAGVEDVVGNTTLHIPLARMVDDGLTEGMVEWVVGHTLRHHLGIDLHIHGQDGQWRAHVPPLARDRKVGILGLGELGRECAYALRALKFDVAGWSRSEKQLNGIKCYHGDVGLRTILARSEILILLLPLTDETREVLDAKRLALLPEGAVIINPGRGPLIDDAALLNALDSGRIGHATLDVFRVEPLPVDHPFWTHPRVTVTPHIASETRPESASRVIAENIRRGEAGAPFMHLVNRDLGY